MVPCCCVPGSCPVAAPRDLVLGLGVRAAPARECTAEAACAVHDAQGVCWLGVVLFMVFVAVWYVVECGLVLLWASGCCLGLSNLYPSSCEHVTAMAGFGESWLFGLRSVLINHPFVVQSVHSRPEARIAGCCFPPSLGPRSAVVCCTQPGQQLCNFKTAL